MEKMVTSDEKEMKRFMLSSPESGVSEQERNAREAYRYCKVIPNSCCPSHNTFEALLTHLPRCVGLENLDAVPVGLL
jgi:hypothetical protein